jgi:SAM-dependent methyltransferase
MKHGSEALHMDAEHVRRYYDDNTRLFLSLGQGTDGTIHRAVWGPGVETRAQAMRYVDELVIERLRRLMSERSTAEREAGASGETSGEPLQVADLGCGVCSSLCYIAERLPIAGTGVTISPKQAALATERIRAQGLTGKVRCVQGDFCNLPAGLGPVDLAFGIESFIHAPDARAFFEQCSRLVRPGGYLLVCDDMLADGAVREDRRARSWLERVRKGWKGCNLISETEATALAASVGFERAETLDLGPYLEMKRPRDYAIGALMRAFGWLPVDGSYWSMLYGGHALQLCLKRGWIQHRVVVWRHK